MRNTATIIIVTLILLFIPALTQADSSLTSEDLEFIKFMQDSGLLPEDDTDLNSVTHESIVRVKNAFKGLYGADYETAKKPPDPKFSSPEKTWDLYKQALIEGDIDLAQSCLLPEFAEVHIEVLKALGNEKIKEMARAMRPIQKIKQDEESAKYRIRKTEINGGQEMDITYYVYFVKIFGAWKIARY